MGLFDLLTPLFQAFFTSTLTHFNPLVVVILIGAMSGALSMWLYVLTSPQQKIAVIKQQINELKTRILNAKVDDEVMPLHKKLLSLSLKNLGQIILPVILSSLPVLFLLVPVDAVYSDLEPKVGEKLLIQTIPSDIRMEFLSDSIVEEEGAFYLLWPGSGEIQFLEGEPYSSSLVKPKSILHKYQWWNTLFANKNGYLPNNAPVDSISFSYPQHELVGFGPSWLRTAFFWFFVSTFSASIVIKFVFKIE